MFPGSIPRIDRDVAGEEDTPLMSGTVSEPVMNLFDRPAEDL
jgi:hypothetical protein